MIKNAETIIRPIVGNSEEWLSSRDAMKALRISSCELMHRRERGSIKFEKRGNAYFYKVRG